MLTFERIDNLDGLDWPALDALPDRTVCQTRPWLNYVAECQGATPVVAAVSDGSGVIGWFTALIVRKFGVPILGSPFPGWTTLYMGFNLPADFPRPAAVRALVPFAFDALGCWHLELMDRGLSRADADGLGWSYRVLRNREIDLTPGEEAVWAQMGRQSARWGVNKAAKAGVVVAEVAAGDPQFARQYCDQMRDVFAKQGLAPTYGLPRVESLIRHLQPSGKLLLLRATAPDGTCLATGLFPGHGALAYFWGGASWRQHQGLRPNDAVQWQAIRWWLERGCRRYDFGGGGEYKKKYGGVEIEVPWLRRSKYPILENMRSVSRRTVDALQRLRGRSLH